MTTEPVDLTSFAPTKMLRRKAASQYLIDRWGIPVAGQTLAKLAVLGGGPSFRKFGRFPLYSRADLDEWAVSKFGPRQRSTSDYTHSGSTGRDTDD